MHLVDTEHRDKPRYLNIYEQYVATAIQLLSCSWNPSVFFFFFK